MFDELGGGGGKEREMERCVTGKGRVCVIKREDVFRGKRWMIRRVCFWSPGMSNREGVCIELKG
jgi:hypothetical protein